VKPKEQQQKTRMVKKTSTPIYIYIMQVEKITNAFNTPIFFYKDMNY